MRKTYSQWQEDGYNVRKGERMVGKSNRGEALFDRSQVEQDGPRDYEWDDDYDRYESVHQDYSWY